MKFTENDHNYIESDEERDEGHEDTCYKNLECDTPLGCNLGIDVAGQLSEPKLPRAAVFGRCPFFMGISRLSIANEPLDFCGHDPDQAFFLNFCDEN